MQQTPVIYFDNAATSWPKPPQVLRTLSQTAVSAGGNPGRSGHALSRRAGEVVYHARETAAKLFAASPENVVFTMNCSHALNLAIHGMLRQGDHVIISSMDHNSVSRPVATLAERGVITYSIAEVTPDNARTLEHFRRLIRPETRAVICTLVSNVTGQILPYQGIAALCKEYGLRFIADGAQACGILPVTLADGIDVLCTAGHKGLYGPMGTGLLVTNNSVRLEPLMQGGTGSLSASLMQPDFLPDALESGTVNVPGIAALDAGMQWVMHQTSAALMQKETALCQRFLAGLSQIPHCEVYRSNGADYAPVVAFRLSHEQPVQTAERLAANGICMRAGMHCAPLAHRTLGTLPEGTVRFAPSSFNTQQEVNACLRVIAAR